MLVGPAGSDAEFPLWPPLLASRGPGSRSGKHAHHALHVMLALEGELRVRGWGEWRSAAGVVTAPDAVHEIDATGVEVLLVFLDPESAAGAGLLGLVSTPDRAEPRTSRAKSRGSRSDRSRGAADLREDGLDRSRGAATARESASERRMSANSRESASDGRVLAKSRESDSQGRVPSKPRADGFRLIAAGERDELIDLAPAQLMRQHGVAWAQRVVNVLGAAQPSAAGEASDREGAIVSGAGASGSALPRVHPAVRRALRHLRASSPSQDQSLAALAKVAGLSEGRFMHAFTESVGIPLRPYLAWLKLQRAAAAIVTGSTLVEAAYGAGFADAAHMTRAFRRMFGVRPSELRK